MKIIDIGELPIVDFNISNIVALTQKWDDGARYSYIKSPRPDNGFILITSGCIEYSDIDKNIVKAFKGDVAYIPKGKYYNTKFSSENATQTTCILINFLIADANNTNAIFSDNIVNIGNIDNIGIEKTLARLPVRTRRVQTS